MTRRQDDKMTRWQNDKMTKWQDDNMTGLQDDTMTWCYDDMMTRWQDHMFKGSYASKLETQVLYFKSISNSKFWLTDLLTHKGKV